MKLISLVKTLILEQLTLVSRFKSPNGQMVDILSNLHSKTSQGSKSELARITEEEIMESFEDIKDIAVNQSNKILNRPCIGKDCGLLVRDYMLGFDYQFWLRRRGENTLVMTVNTSIIHPKKLFNKEKHNIIIIEKDGSHTIVESMQGVKINGKYVQFYLFD